MVWSSGQGAASHWHSQIYPSAVAFSCQVAKISAEEEGRAFGRARIGSRSLFFVKIFLLKRDRQRFVTVDLGFGINFTSYVGFTSGMDLAGIGLLGQQGFFDYDNVALYNKQNRFTIETT